VRTVARRQNRRQDKLFEVRHMKIPRQIESLFGRYPTLAGFSVRGVGAIPDSCVRSGADDELFADITTALAELLSEEPESREFLHGRTFARTLH